MAGLRGRKWPVAIMLSLSLLFMFVCMNVFMYASMHAAAHLPRRSIHDDPRLCRHPPRTRRAAPLAARRRAVVQRRRSLLLRVARAPLGVASAAAVGAVAAVALRAVVAVAAEAREGGRRRAGLGRRAAMRKPGRRALDLAQRAALDCCARKFRSIRKSAYPRQKATGNDPYFLCMNLLVAAEVAGCIFVFSEDRLLQMFVYSAAGATAALAACPVHGWRSASWNPRHKTAFEAISCETGPEMMLSRDEILE